MKDVEGHWRGRFRGVGAALRRSRPEPAGISGGSASTAALVVDSVREESLRTNIGNTAFAFRGYDVSNSGRSAELLSHPEYGPIVREELIAASGVAADALHRPIDLVSYVQEARPTALADFALDIAMIVAMELAQLRLLEEVYGVPVRQARLSFGYSLGELSAMILGGTFRMEEILPVPLTMADDCASLAPETSMGILFTRAPSMPEEGIERLCAAVSCEGNGLVAPSAYLSPNTALLLGQGKTLDRVDQLKSQFLPPKVMLRRNPNHWPPLHTPLVRLKNIPNRTATAIYAIGGNHPEPSPPIISCVTGRMSHDGLTCRETLVQWTERPQRLWDAIDGTLSAGVERVIHVGPSPNLVPATFARLANNVNKHLGNKYLRGIVSSMNQHAWLASMLPHRATLLRAPFVEQVILEDWLLAQKVGRGVETASAQSLPIR